MYAIKKSIYVNEFKNRIYNNMRDKNLVQLTQWLLERQRIVSCDNIGIVV